MNPLTDSRDLKNMLDELETLLRDANIDRASPRLWFKNLCRAFDKTVVR